MIKIDYKDWQDKFLLTETGKAVLNDYPNIICGFDKFPSIVIASWRYGLTPREMVSEMMMPRTLKPGPFSIVPFYYMDILQNKNPSKVIDLGCGSNMFKKYYPNIIGIDANHPNADVQETYNQDFIDRHKNEFESIISINMTMDWMPDNSNVTYENLGQAISSFTEILSPGGQAALCIGAWSLNFTTPRSWFENNNCNPWEVKNLTNYVKDTVLSVPGINITHFDIDLDILNVGVSHDGEIRLVFTKTDK